MLEKGSFLEVQRFEEGLFSQDFLMLEKGSLEVRGGTGSQKVRCLWVWIASQEVQWLEEDWFPGCLAAKGMNWLSGCPLGIEEGAAFSASCKMGVNTVSLAVARLRKRWLVLCKGCHDYFTICGIHPHDVQLKRRHSFSVGLVSC
jgi:hypothetical protein